jgi:hypothetical protein
VINKNLAVGTAVILIVVVSCIAFYSVTAVLQYINPVAVLAAVIVLIAGMAWFRKSVT